MTTIPTTENVLIFVMVFALVAYFICSFNRL